MPITRADYAFPTPYPAHLDTVAMHRRVGADLANCRDRVAALVMEWERIPEHQRQNHVGIAAGTALDDARRDEVELTHAYMDVTRAMSEAWERAQRTPDPMRRVG